MGETRFKEKPLGDSGMFPPQNLPDHLQAAHVPVGFRLPCLASKGCLVVYLKFKYHWMFRFIWLPSFVYSPIYLMAPRLLCITGPLSCRVWEGSGKAFQRRQLVVGQALGWGPLIFDGRPDSRTGQQKSDLKNRCQSWCCLAAAQILGLASSL